MNTTEAATHSEQGGLTKPEIARRHGISERQIDYLRKKLRRIIKNVT